MTLHQLLFPHCNDRELKLAVDHINELEAEVKSLKDELSAEIAWNRMIADKLINASLTKNGSYGIPSRTPVEKPAVEPKKADTDATRDEQIAAKVKEFERVYAERGHNVPITAIRQMVEQNFDYLMDDERVEL